MSVNLGVHRCRFVDYTPSAISAIAFPPLPLPSPLSKQSSQAQSLPFGTLVVGHSNGNIDICEWSGQGTSTQSAQAWVVKKTLPGSYPSKIDSLALVIKNTGKNLTGDVPGPSNLRLFSSGGGSDLVEWDITGGYIRRTINSQGGTIWSMAVNPSHTHLALGCEDGTVRLVMIKDDQLVHYRKFDHVKGRILSIAWGPPSIKAHTGGGNEENDEATSEWSDTWLVTGGSDSSLRKWDVASGKVVDRMSVDTVRGERTLVWALGVIGDGTIVSGDSLGLVKFWDSRTCTQLQSFKGHGADVLCLTVGPDGNTVYTSGVDQKITQFSLVKTSNSAGRIATRWIQAASRRLHSHDVRSVAIWPPYSCLPPSHKRTFPTNVAPVLASGGLDMSVVLTPAATPSSTLAKIINPLSTSVDCTFEESHHRKLAYPLGPFNNTSTHIASQPRLVFSTREAGISAWRIPLKPSGSEAEGSLAGVEDKQATFEHLLEMELHVKSNLLSSAVSNDGRWLAVSDIHETRLYSLSLAEDQIRPRKVRTFTASLQEAIGNASLGTGASQLAFSPDSRKLVVATALSSQLVVVDLSSPDEVAILRVFSPSVFGSGRKITGRKLDEDVEMTDQSSTASVGPKKGQILRLAISADGQWLASTDEHGQTLVFNLDSLQHHCALPTFSRHVQTMSFDAHQPNVLLLAFPDNTIQIFDVESRQFPPWSKAVCSNLPRALTEAHDPILGICLNPGEDDGETHYILVWGSTWLAKLKLDGINGSSWSGRKRRRQSVTIAQSSSVLELPGQEEPSEFKVIRGYRPILNVAFLGVSELVVIERPLVDVLASLTPPYFSEKYGQT